MREAHRNSSHSADCESQYGTRIPTQCRMLEEEKFFFLAAVSAGSDTIRRRVRFKGCEIPGVAQLARGVTSGFDRCVEFSCLCLRRIGQELGWRLGGYRRLVRLLRSTSVVVALRLWLIVPER